MTTKKNNSMPDIFYLIQKWWKQVLGVVLLSVLVVGIITFLKPRKYLSVTTAVPASSFAADKSKIFNSNIEALYSSLGTADDLDMIIGTAQLDTVYLAVTDQFNLFDHYKVEEEGGAARIKATLLLKGDTKVMKSEYGELKVKVWDTDKNLAPQLADAIMQKLQNIHSDLMSIGNQSTLNGLQAGKLKTGRQIDSLSEAKNNLTKAGAEKISAMKENLSGQLQQYEKLIGEYQLMIDSKPPALIIVEKAKASEWPDKPKRMQIMAATAVLGFLFALLTALVLERRKISNQ
jgi:uncharacterized protein involved in exopolysaccharide biosynthesis